MRGIGSVFDANVSCIANNDYNNFMALLTFSNNSVHADVHFNVDSYLNHNFHDHNFQAKPENNSNNFKLEILFLVFSSIFYHIILKHNRKLRIKIFEFLILLSALNVMKYFNHSDGIKTCSQSHLFIYESISICDNEETSSVYSDLVFISISKLEYRNSNSYFNLLLLLSGDISLKPGPFHNDQLQPQSEWSILIRGGSILSTSMLIVG